MASAQKQGREQRQITMRAETKYKETRGDVGKEARERAETRSKESRDKNKHVRDSRHRDQRQ